MNFSSIGHSVGIPEALHWEVRVRATALRQAESLTAHWAGNHQSLGDHFHQEDENDGAYD
jgi:hypothetical protein